MRTSFILAGLFFLFIHLYLKHLKGRDISHQDVLVIMRSKKWKES